ncbi:MAG: hypothetical protein ACXQS9_04480, partial [Methermicoccaceae archaeon]
MARVSTVIEMKRKKMGTMLTIVLLVLVLALPAAVAEPSRVADQHSMMHVHHEMQRGGTAHPVLNATNTTKHSMMHATNTTNESAAWRMPAVASTYRHMLAAKDKLNHVEHSYRGALMRYLGLARASPEQRLTAAKSLSLSRADIMLSQLELMRAQVSVWDGCTISSERLEEYARWTEHMREAIGSAQSEDELRKLNQEMAEQWQRMSLEMQLCASQLEAHRIEDVREHAHNASSVLESEIHRLEAENKSTARLTSQLSRYNTTLERADSHEKRAREVLALHAGFDEHGGVVDVNEARRTVSTVRA